MLWSSFRVNHQKNNSDWILTLASKEIANHILDDSGF